MATNLIYDDLVLSVACSHPATPVSGEPVRYGQMTGVALTDEGDGGNGATLTTVDFRGKVWDLTVDDNEGTGIAVGDTIYFHDTGTGTGAVHLNNSATGMDAVFGVALETVGANATTLINVLHIPIGLNTTLASNAVVAATITDAILTGAKAAVVAESNVVGGIPVIHEIPITAGALADTDIVLTHKTRVLNVWLILRGAGVATTTLQVKNGANAITDAMAASGSDQAVVRCASINDAYYEIAAGGTLRVTSATGATQPAALVVVEGVRVA